MAENAKPVDEQAPDEGSRRKFLGLTGAAAGVVGAMVAAPVAPLFVAPLLQKPEEERWIPVGPADQFGEERREVSYEYEHLDGWYEATRTRRVVISKQGEEWLAISSTCTHMGCGVLWKPEERKFFCPCHGGEFDENGKAIKAPAPPDKPLQKLAVRVNPETNQLEVREA